MISQKNGPGIAVTGFGYWGPNLARNFFENPDCRLVAICDSDPTALVRAQISFPTTTPTAEYEDILKNPDIDAVVIATPVSSHFSLVEQALEHGKDVLVEKPCSVNTEAARQLVERADELNRVLAVDYTFLFNGAVLKIKELISNGEFGDALYIDSVRINLGLFQSEMNVVNDLASHDLSIILYLLDMGPTHVSVSGMRHGPADQEALAYVHLTFPNGVIAHIHVSWLSPVKVRRMVIAGTKKMIIYDDLMPMEKVRIYDHGIEYSTNNEVDVIQQRVEYRTGDILVPKLSLREALSLEAEIFVRSISTRRMEPSDGRFGLSVMRVLDACKKSLDNDGAIIPIKDGP